MEVKQPDVETVGLAEGHRPLMMSSKGIDTGPDSQVCRSTVAPPCFSPPLNMLRVQQGINTAEVEVKVNISTSIKGFPR